MSRPKIPADVSRAILIEAGHRCAVCGVSCPLERAHIIPWRECREHTADNLICLCANCHERADLEKWGVSVLQKYKANPWVARQNSTLVQALPRSQVSITIEKEFESFDDHSESMLKHALASFLQVSPSSIKIISKEQGSTKLKIELPTAAADELLDGYKREDPNLQSFLAIFPIREIKQETAPATSMSVDKGPEQSVDSTSDDDDPTIAPKIAADYESRFQEIFTTFYPRIVALFRGRGATSEDATDLAQETFMRVYKGLGGFRGEASLETWILRIAMNVWRNSLRDRAASRRSRETQEVPIERPPTRHVGLEELAPLDDALQHERRLELAEALSELPPRMRRALLLWIRQDRSLVEIASLLEISPQTVKLQLHAARRQLRERLGAYFEEVEQ